MRYNILIKSKGVTTMKNLFRNRRHVNAHTYEVYETDWTVCRGVKIATFVDRTHAEMFAAMLNADAPAGVTYDVCEPTEI